MKLEVIDHLFDIVGVPGGTRIVLGPGGVATVGHRAPLVAGGAPLAWLGPDRTQSFKFDAIGHRLPLEVVHGVH